ARPATGEEGCKHSLLATFDCNAVMSATKMDGFSLAEARAIVRDLFVPDERIYWLDFLTTILVGHGCFALTRVLFHSHLEPRWLALAMTTGAFVVQCACYYRAVMFIHEIVHR